MWKIFLVLPFSCVWYWKHPLRCKFYHVAHMLSTFADSYFCWTLQNNAMMVLNLCSMLFDMLIHTIGDTFWFETLVFPRRWIIIRLWWTSKKVRKVIYTIRKKTPQQTENKSGFCAIGYHRMIINDVMLGSIGWWMWKLSMKFDKSISNDTIYINFLIHDLVMIYIWCFHLRLINTRSLFSVWIQNVCW